jgi:hypothetical protein
VFQPGRVVVDLSTFHSDEVWRCTSGRGEGLRAGLTGLKRAAGALTEKRFGFFKNLLEFKKKIFFGP